MQDIKIHYRLEIKTEGMRYDAMINGITLQKDPDGLPLTVEIPVGQFLRTGKNTLDLRLYPWDETDTINSREDSCISLTLKMHREDREDLGGIIISQLKYTAKDDIKGTGFESSTPEGRYKFTDKLIFDNEGDYKILGTAIKKLSFFEGAKEITQEIHMQTPYPEWAFFRGNSIPKLGSLPKEEYLNQFKPPLFEKYELIHDALKRKDIDSIMPLFEERNRELEIAFYYETGTYEKMLRAAFQEEFDDNMLLKDLDTKYSSAVISLYGNLIKLGKSSPIIKFHDKEKTIFNGYDIFFRKEGDDWIISR